MSRSTERAARNEASFRAAKEAIDTARNELGVAGRTPYICECKEEACTTLIALTRGEYRSIRPHAARFLIAKGHNSRSGKVVEEHGEFVVVDKVGGAADTIREEA